MLALACGSAAQAQQTSEPAQQPQLALMGTVPIYWGEAASMGELLAAVPHAHWARAQLEQDFQLVPLDFLTAEALAQHRYLLMAQPRGLAPTENVALDDWVRGGGHLLLLADPMMTGPSRFPIGDRRRPQDVTLLSPILAHWGLQLSFDDSQPEGISLIDMAGQQLPVNLAGRLGVAEDGPCHLLAGAVLASCSIGAGQVLVLADAAILDIAGPYPQASAGLAALTATIFGKTGDEAGMTGEMPHDLPQDHAIPPFSAAGNLSSIGEAMP